MKGQKQYSDISTSQPNGVNVDFHIIVTTKEIKLIDKLIKRLSDMNYYVDFDYPRELVVQTIKSAGQCGDTYYDISEEVRMCLDMTVLKTYGNARKEIIKAIRAINLTKAYKSWYC